jgi:hypothetical protein
VSRLNSSFWETCIKEHLRLQKKKYLIRLGIKTNNSTSPEMIRLLIEMKRTIGGKSG